MRLVLIITLLSFVFSVDAVSQRKSPSRGASSASTASLNEQADRLAQAYWNSRFTKCGEDYYTISSEMIYQIKEFSFSVQSWQLSRADELNGVQFKGVTIAKTGLMRSFSVTGDHLQGKGWSRWSEAGWNLSAELRMVGGKWNNLSGNQHRAFRKVSCAEVGNPLATLQNMKTREKKVAYDAKVQEFLRTSESRWKVFHGGLPDDSYPFMADNSNLLMRAVLLPNRAWFLQSSYRNQYSRMPNDIVAALNKGFDASTLAVSPTGSWVVLHPTTEKTQGVIRSDPYSGNRTGEIERRSVEWGGGHPRELTDEILRLHNEWMYIDRVEFDSKGEWVIVYHRSRRCGFSFIASAGINQKFYETMKGLWSQGTPIFDLGFVGENGFVIVTNRRDYLESDVPQGVSRALSELKSHNVNSVRGISLAFGYDGSYLLFLADYAWMPWEACIKNDPYPFNPPKRLPSTNSAGLNGEDGRPTLRSRDPDDSGTPDLDLAKVIRQALLENGFGAMVVNVIVFKSDIVKAEIRGQIQGQTTEMIAANVKRAKGIISKSIRSSNSKFRPDICILRSATLGDGRKVEVCLP